MNAFRPLTSLFFLLCLFALAGCTTTYTDSTPSDEYVEPPPPPPPPPEIEFYELAEFGEWIHVHPFGTVWRPYAGSDWRPYIYGHWVWSDWGWTWVSYEPFGWAVYHYGYWHFDTFAGWIWVPEYEWEPVRVQWVEYDDYVCWAPMAPPGYLIPDPWDIHATDVWVVVNARNFTNYDLHRFRVKPASYKDRYRTNAPVHREQPRVKTIEERTRKSIQRVHIDVKDHAAGARTYKKVVLPASEQKRVEQYKRKSQKPTTKGETSGSKTKKTR